LVTPPQILSHPDTDGGEADDGIVRWRRIERVVAGEIASGQIRPGDRIPTEQELARRFGVHRHTVRRAMTALAQRGLIRIEQGRGTFVQEDVIDYALGRRTRFSENLLRQRREPTGRTLRTLEQPASSAVAAALEIAPGSPVALIEKLGEADGIPISIGQHFFPLPRFAGIIDRHAETGSITHALATFGVGDYVRRTTRLTARIPNHEEASHLRQSPTRPILQSEAVNVDAEGRPVEYGITKFAGERVQVVVET
jgi:GntR family phosphonate transport system transcriptional regulator